MKRINSKSVLIDDVDMENANLMIKLTDEGYVPGEYIKGVRAYIYRKE